MIARSRKKRKEERGKRKDELEVMIPKSQDYNEI